MKIQYFGTAAYEGIPSLFCQCDSCKRAMKLGGKNMRTRAQALINEEILMDFNADTVAHYQTYKFDWEKVKYCLITHSHSDHLYPNDLVMFAEPGYVPKTSHIDFYAGASGYTQICYQFSSGRVDHTRATINEIATGNMFRMGENTVLVLQADHDLTSSPVIYAIEDKDKKRILYAHDTGVFTDGVVADLKRMGRFDIVSLDCTGALLPGKWVHGHMNLNTDVDMKELLLREGLADEATKFVVTHFSHNSLLGHDHEELCAEASKYGFIVGYDGLIVDA